MNCTKYGQFRSVPVGTSSRLVPALRSPSAPALELESAAISTESLILAQDERWRRA
jgi:hypothetical protein